MRNYRTGLLPWVLASNHITSLLADPALIRAEISKRLETARTSDPATRQRKQLELQLAKAATVITRMIEAFSEQLITIDELRARMPALPSSASARGRAATSRPRRAQFGCAEPGPAVSPRQPQHQ